MKLNRLGIDASNLQGGGGLTHLIELLQAADPPAFGINQVVVWGGQKILNRLPKKPWLLLKTDPLLDGSIFSRIYWQKFKLTQAAEDICDMLFIPGGFYLANFQPYIAMNQNLLPFDLRELRRYGASWMSLKFVLLRLNQSACFRGAKGVIFLSEYAKAKVMKQIGTLSGELAIISHGANENFLCSPRLAKPVSDYSLPSPFRLLYISSVYPYKHQWNVANAVHELRRKGYAIDLDFIGLSYPPSFRRLQKVIRRIDPGMEYIHYFSEIPYSELSDWYHRADGFVFASTCECFSITLLEAMSAGLPIACSNKGPMVEQLGKAGIYFDPERTESIVTVLEAMIRDHVLRGEHAHISYQRSKEYSWARCARETFGFISKVMNQD